MPITCTDIPKDTVGLLFSDEQDPSETDEPDKFLMWLTKKKLHSYYKDLAAEGYDDLESLTLLTEEEINDLATKVSMKPGRK